MAPILSKTLKLGAVALAIGLLFGAGAKAQSNTSGNLAGRATAGDQITVQNTRTGFLRTITVGKNGRFRLGSLPVGEYLVTLKHADGTVYMTAPAAVQIGRTTQVSAQNPALQPGMQPQPGAQQ